MNPTFLQTFHVNIKRTMMVALCSCIGNQAAQAVEYTPYVELGVGAYQLDITVKPFGSTKTTLPSGFLAAGLYIDWDTDFGVGLQLRASGSEAKKTTLSATQVTTQIQFPLYSTFIIPQYTVSEDWRAFILIGASSSPSYSLNYTANATTSTQQKPQFSYGLGARYHVNEDFHISMEWVSLQPQVNVNDSTRTTVSTAISGFTLGLVYQFSDEHDMLHTHPMPTIPLPSVTIDSDAPALRLLGSKASQHILGTPYLDAGATAIDNIDGDLSPRIRVSGKVNTEQTGFYTLQYDVIDNAHNAAAPIWRTVQVILDPTIKTHIHGINIHFPSDSSYYPESFAKDMDNIVQVMQDYPMLNIEVRGHTDDRADDSYNLWLAQKRVDAVTNYIIGHGINEKRLQTNVYGEERPKNNNNSRDGRAENRRVDFRFINEDDINKGIAPAAPIVIKP